MVVYRLAGEPSVEFSIDLDAQTIALSDERPFTFPLDPFTKRCLALGVDQLGYLLDAAVEIDAYEHAHTDR
jgi:3-isopropylmalate/(R)-2-methylmalate dehydratase small subunit